MVKSLFPPISGHRAVEHSRARGMVAAFARACGRDIPVQVEPRRAGDTAVMQAGTSCAATELGWTAIHGLDDMTASTWARQSANLDGYGTH